MDNENKDLGTQGAEDSSKGKLNQLGGKVQKNVGKVTGNEEMEAKGKMREVGGKVQDKAGQVERNVDDKLNNNTTTNE